MAPDIDSARIEPLNGSPVRDRNFALYWMQQSQRARFNHALEYAIGQANEMDQPLVVLFVLMDDYPEANLRHYQFMLEGLRETQTELAERGIPLLLRRGAVEDVVIQASLDASMLICDRGYLRHQKKWRKRIAEQVDLAMVQIEADVVVPVNVASRKVEYAARTIRPKIHRHLDQFLVDLPSVDVKHNGLNLNLGGIELDDIDALLADLKLDRSVGPVDWIQGGTARAYEQLTQFIEHSLAQYTQGGKQPHRDFTSHLSPYLHFGQISSVEVALRITEARNASKENRDAFLEQLIVRRELACNFTEHHPDYDRYAGLPNWSRGTLAAHKHDTRSYKYTRRELDQAQTHDPYWNAAMEAMRHTGYLHNHMRMYWGKMILNWSSSPEYAYRTALQLNNRYFLDGRDPVSFANVGWLFGLHDRPWPERPVFGTVRSMSQQGLHRKTDPDAFVEVTQRSIAEQTKE